MNRVIQTVPRLESYRGVFKFVQNPMPVIDDAIARYGSTYYTRIVGGRKLVMTIDPQIAQHVLQKNNRNYHKSELQTESLGRYVGHGLLTSNGDYWLRQRRLIQPGFHRDKLQGLVDIMHLEIKAFCEELTQRVRTNPAVDINEAMVELTLRIVSKALFSTGIAKETIEELGKSFVELQKHIVKEVRQPVFNWWRVLSGKRKETMRLAEQTKDIMRKIIHERRQSGEAKDDLLDMLLNTRYEDNGEAMTNKQLLDETIILFVAGHETTANTLAWTLYAMVQDKSLVTQGLESSRQLLEHRLSLESLKASVFLDQLLNEGMRMYPPAWILDRIALADDRVDNVVINKGDLVGIYVYGVHRHPEHWTEPDRFIPNRFSADNEVVNYSFIPFGGGPRLCIGNHFAMIEMKIALAEMLSRFEMKLISGQEVNFEPLITLRPKEPIWMQLRSL